MLISQYYMGFGGGSRVHFNYAGIRIHHLKAKNERNFVGKKRNVSTEDSGNKTNSIHDQYLEKVGQMHFVEF